MSNLTEDAFPNGCSTLQQLIGQAHELMTLLMQEHGALEKRQSADLIALAKQKQISLEALERSFEREARFLATVQAKAGAQKVWKCTPRDLSAWPQTLLGLWKELCTLLRQCRYQNAANGELIKVLRCHTSGMLSLIQTVMPGNDVYNVTGRRCSNTVSSYSNTA